jgi:hypothetical protein
MTDFPWFWAGVSALVLGLLIRLYVVRRRRYDSERRDELRRFEGELFETLRLLRLRESDDWLKELYKAHTDRFMKENDRIWETGKILLPLSLGAFAAYGAVPEPKGSQIALALASFGLLLIWHLIAACHRHFQDIHHSWLTAIERTLEISARRPRDRLSLEWVRRGFLVGVAVLWLALLWQSACEHLPCVFCVFNKITCS